MRVEPGRAGSDRVGVGPGRAGSGRVGSVAVIVFVDGAKAGDNNSSRSSSKW